MVKLFHFITDTNIGGAGKLLCTQIKGADREKLDITVVLPRGSKLKNYLRPCHCKIIEVAHSSDCSFSPLALIEDIAIINRYKPNIVHSHASLSSRIASFLCKTPARLHTRHCIFPLSPYIKKPLGKKLCGAFNNMLSTKMIAVAEGAKENLKEMGCDEKKISVIINGSEPLRKISEKEKAELRLSLGFAENDFVLGICARLEHYKGHKTLLEALSLCKSQAPHIRLIILGDGTCRTELEALCKELGLCDIVRFIGFVDDVAPYYNIMNVNVNCSYGTETSSLALSEGMSLGIPSLVSDFGGNCAMVQNCFNGLVFPQKNHTELSKCLLRLYNNPEFCKRLSQNTLERYKKEFTADAMNIKMNKLYLSIV